MECRLKAYEGTEPGAVMIHAGDDDAVVFPLMERLGKNGLRIWHDAEIRKIEVEYTAGWKKHQAAGSCFLIFLSENAVNRHIFRERFTSAIKSGKPIIIIQTLNQDALSPGMRLQTEKAVRILRSSYIPQEKLTEEMIGLQELKACMGKTDPGIIPNPYPSGQAKLVTDSPITQKRNISPTNRTMMEIGGMRQGNQQQSVSPKYEEPQAGGITQEETIELTVQPASEGSLDETMLLSKNESDPVYDPDFTFIPRRPELPVILSLSSGERKNGILGEAIVGRTKKVQGAMADISFADDCKLFSGKHFQLIYIDGQCILICKHPNGMNVDGQEMQPGDKCAVESKALIQIPSNATLSQIDSNEVHPAYLVVAIHESAEELRNTAAVAYLQAEKTGEIRYFTDLFNFGRGNP